MKVRVNKQDKNRINSYTKAILDFSRGSLCSLCDDNSSTRFLVVIILAAVQIASKSNVRNIQEARKLPTPNARNIICPSLHHYLLP